MMWDETMLEVEKGWISEDPKPDLERVLLAKRFCIRQSAKHRLIDDFTIGGLNDCCGMSERLRVQAVDSMAALVSFSLNVKTKAFWSAARTTFQVPTNSTGLQNRTGNWPA